MTAKTQAERSAKAAAKRDRLGEEELRHRVRPGIKAKLADLMQWNGIEEQTEAIQLLILNAHAAGPAGSAPLLSVPRHEITVSENVAQRLSTEGAAEAGRLDRAEA
ncbi:hypothetical protein ACFSKY_22785 [Azotobacter chroococcum]|uniref:Uncharacterized protein n=1 Tax=Azotobacter chroococcum TaxID=353 RepID=A0A4R1PLC1_9GAMM|nr:hypothetical protein [Azotobacter chroococcum]TBV90498.1 hypothetical protein E0E53_23475 [Azotobacter chroococcum]TCL32009.1 hypothetical protein EV691_1093 [Azotobacter chroococcum]